MQHRRNYVYDPLPTAHRQKESRKPKVLVGSSSSGLEPIFTLMARQLSNKNKSRAAPITRLGDLEYLAVAFGIWPQGLGLGMGIGYWDLSLCRANTLKMQNGRKRN